MLLTLAYSLTVDVYAVCVDAKGIAKWEAWDSVRGTPQPEARRQYCAFAKKMFRKYGLRNA